MFFRSAAARARSGRVPQRERAESNMLRVLEVVSMVGLDEEQVIISLMGKMFSKGHTHTLRCRRDRPPWKMLMSTPTIPS